MTDNEIPKDARGRRLPAVVRQINLRMSKPYISKLDELCAANGRSRREIVEILTDEAHAELEENPHARISPL